MAFKVLLTCTGGTLAPQMIRQLQSSTRHAIEVVAVDNNHQAAASALAQAFETVPLGTDPAYVPAVREIVERHNVSLVLPTSDEEALALAAAREDIEATGAMLGCTDTETLSLVSDKARTYAALAEHGLPVPDWVPLTDRTSAEETLRDLIERNRGEAVVKPSVSRGGRNVCVIRSDLQGTESIAGGREMHMDPGTFFQEGWLDRIWPAGPLMAMARLHGIVCDIDLLGWNGVPQRIVARRRRHSALPNEGHTVLDDPQLLDLGARLISALNLSWLYDCDVMFSSDGRPYILEVNPRGSGSVAVSVAAGVPLLDDVVSLAKGEPLPDVPYPAGETVIPYTALHALAP